MIRCPMISFVIPNYNSGSQLTNAVESIYRESSLEFEIIVIDDGSTDDSLMCLKRLFFREIQSGHIQIVKNEHLGAGAARNVGILKSSGLFVMFVDADDEIVNIRAIERYLNSDCKNDYVAFMSRTDNLVLGYNEAVKSILGIVLRQKVDSGPCSKLYRLKILKENQIFFPTEIIVGEDLIFNLRVLKCVRSIRVIRSGVYKVNNSSSSVTHMIDLDTSEKDMMRLILFVNKELSIIHKQKILELFVLKQFFTLIVKCAKSQQRISKCLKVLDVAKNDFQVNRLRLSNVKLMELIENYNFFQLILLIFFWKVSSLSRVNLSLLRWYIRGKKEPRFYLL